MDRRPSTQDLTWLTDLHDNKQLDLNPPYQRRSVWTRKDKQFFLDTIFRNYPSPAIFLHKTINESGKATYHVVDGKQRTTTILEFLQDKIKIGSDFGDIRLNGKKWSQVQSEADLKRKFWNYQITVEMVDVLEVEVINEVFDRLNRNSRRLTRQELRHAKFDGWFISEVEEDVKREDWRKMGLVNIGRDKRMADVQYLSELFLVVLEGKMLGFDQDDIDDLYAKYDSLEDPEVPIDEDAFRERLDRIKSYLLEMQETNQAISEHGRGAGHFYTLWSVVALHENLPPAPALAERYRAFMAAVSEVARQVSEAKDVADLFSGDNSDLALAFNYYNASRGASTDLTPRLTRYNVLVEAILS